MDFDFYYVLESTTISYIASLYHLYELFGKILISSIYIWAVSLNSR